MMDDDKLIAEFNRNASDFFARSNIQRQEIYRAFQYRDGHHWGEKELRDRLQRDKKVTTIPMTGAMVRAVSGTECMQDKALDMIALDPDFDVETDIMKDATSYVRHASGADSERSRAKEDAVACGLGATVTWLDMTQKDAIAGHPVCERIFPGFIGFDQSSRGSRLNARARWMFYAEPVNNDYLMERVEQAEKEGKKLTGGDTDFRGFLLSFSRQDNLDEVDFVYHYMWWEYSDIYDLQNPFVEGGDKQLIAAIAEDDDAANVMGEVAEKHAIDWQAQYWSLDPEAFREIKAAIETIGLLTGYEAVKTNSSKRKGKTYYKAEIAKGVVLSKSRSYTQGGHALNVIPGYYDETLDVYYGIIRPLSHIQDSLNLVASEMLEVASTTAHGGPSYIKGGAEAIERLKKEKAQHDALTPLPKDAEVIPKGLPGSGESLLAFTQYLVELMPRVIGLGPEFLGILTTGDMTDALYGKVIRQSYAVLANLANNAAESDRRQGEIEIDIVKLMAAANDGMVLPVLSPGKPAEQYIRLTKQNLARHYAVRIAERPMTVDERQETFNMLSQLAPQFLQAGVNIMPMLAKYARVDTEDKQQLIQLSTPQPQQPDPLNQQMIANQARLIAAQAAKLEQETQEKANRAPITDEVEASNIDKNTAMAMKYRADAGVAVHNATKPTEPQVNV